jgi:beta-lactamase class A
MIYLLVLLSLLAPDRKDLPAQFEQIARAAQGKVGASVRLLETGESASYNATSRFPMQSVYKVPIAMAVLQKVDRGELTLNQKVEVTAQDIMPAPGHSPIREKHPHGGVKMSVRELIRSAVTESDGTASDVLMRLAGRPKPIMDYLHGLGVEDLVVATTEKAMTAGPMVQYRNYATPKSAIALLKALQEGRGLSKASRALLLKDMTETRTGPRRIKGMLPTNTVVAHKTGTDGTRNGFTRATNDIGIVTLPNGRHLLVAVFVSDSKADEKTREGVIAQIARAAWDKWSGTR